MDKTVEYVTTVEEFNGVLASAGDKLVVVDFTASWCGPCKFIGPVFEKMAKEHTNVIFLKVDVDEADELSQKCGISSMPTFQFYKNGEKVKEFSGADENKLRATLAELM